MSLILALFLLTSLHFLHQRIFAAIVWKRERTYTRERCLAGR